MESNNTGAIQEPNNNNSSGLQLDRYGFFGGQEYTDPESDNLIPLEVLRSRELKWRKMCANWDFWYMNNANKLRDRCRKGIPDSFRGEAWQRLCMSPMVLVQRQKLYCSETPDADKKRKSVFGTLSKRSTAKSLQSITSPSFRVTNLKEEDRRNLLFRKVHKIPMRTSPKASSFLSLRSATMDEAVHNTGENQSTVHPFPIPTSNNLSNQVNGSSTTNSLHRASFCVLPNSIKNAITMHCNESAVNCSGYPTLASVHEKSSSPEPQLDPACINADASATRSSGGYASLSTASGTDSIGTNNIQIEIQALGVSSTDSCASFLISATSSSVTSSTSVLSHPIVSVDHLNQSLSNEEDARATLVPNIDPDPEKMYSYYSMQNGSVSDCEQIRRDIDRQFPFHELFDKKGGHGQESLYTLLKAYTVRYPEKGYCQGQAPLAAVLLMYMPEVDSFWTFCEICDRYLSCYYDAGLERIQIDGQVLYAVLRVVAPSVYKFLITNHVDPILVVTKWFMCVYTRTLPWITVLRVLDMFLCEGKVILFKVAIVLLNRLFGTSSQRKSYQGLDEILMRLQEVSSVANNVEEFVRDITRVKLTQKELSQFIIRESKRWFEANKK